MRPVNYSINYSAASNLLDTFATEVFFLEETNIFTEKVPWHCFLMNYLWGIFVISFKIAEFFSQMVSGGPARVAEQRLAFFPNLWELIDYVLPTVSLTKPQLQHTSVTWSLARAPLHYMENYSWQLSLLTYKSLFVRIEARLSLWVDKGAFSCLPRWVPESRLMERLSALQLSGINASKHWALYNSRTLSIILIRC